MSHSISRHCAFTAKSVTIRSGHNGLPRFTTVKWFLEATVRQTFHNSFSLEMPLNNVYWMAPFLNFAFVFFILKVHAIHIATSWVGKWRIKGCFSADLATFGQSVLENFKETINSSKYLKIRVKVKNVFRHFFMNSFLFSVTRTGKLQLDYWKGFTRPLFGIHMFCIGNKSKLFSVPYRI